MPRSGDDKRRPDAEQWHRYRCRNEPCGWQGLLRRSHPPAPPQPRDGSLLVRLGRGMLYWLLAGGLAWAALRALQELIEG